MRIGVTPQNEITADPIAVRDSAQAAEGLGYALLLSYDLGTPIWLHGIHASLGRSAL
jgi:hypothetical protein